MLLNAETRSQTRQRLGGLQQLLMQSSAVVQHLRQLLELRLHLVTVVFIDCVHVSLHLFAYMRHLGN